MKTYKIVLKITTSDWNPPDWIIGEIRDLVKQSKCELNYASIEIEKEEND